MTHEASPRWDQETMLVAWLTAGVSLVSLLYCVRHSELLLYGDAVAHMGIARRVFDSRTPGLLQLGTVWLPLPHLLMIPFVLSVSMWQTGMGGSIPSDDRICFRRNGNLPPGARGAQFLGRARARRATRRVGRRSDLRGESQSHCICSPPP